MPYQLKVNFPGTHKGQELTIPGLGTFKNGSSTEVSDEDADSFRAYQTSNNMPDQTLLQAFKDDPYVEVSKAAAGKDKSDKEGDK
jgi:hypothetical protein